MLFFQMDLDTTANKCLYSKTCGDYLVIVCLYVDDVLILSDGMKGIIETKRFLSSTFKMKDLGEVDIILGIKINRNSEDYALNQTHYIEKVVSKFSHLKIKDANTPFDSSVKLKKNDGRAVAQLEYASAIGSLMYVAQCTRADISFLQYSKFPAILEGYSNASWISSVGDNFIYHKLGVYTWWWGCLLGIQETNLYITLNHGGKVYSLSSNRKRRLLLFFFISKNQVL